MKFQDLTQLPFPVHQSKPARLRPARFEGYVQKTLSLYSTGFEQVSSACAASFALARGRCQGIYACWKRRYSYWTRTLSH